MLLEDWLSLTVVALLAVLHVSGIHRLQLQTWFVQEGLRLFCWMLVCSGLLTALRRARGPGLRPSWFGLAPLVLAPLSLARHFLPFVTLLVGYENVLHLVGRLRPVLYDETLMRLDLLGFRQHPTQWLEAFVTPGRTAWFSFFYLSLYIYPLLSAGVLYLSGRLAACRQFLLTFTGVGLVGYLGYLCVPVIGPRYYFERYYHVALTTGQALPARADWQAWLAAPLSAIADRISYEEALGSGEPRNCFPSLHTAWGLVVLILAYRQLRPLFYVYLFPISQLILSTLYLRFHYVVDLVAGAALAVFGCYAIPRIERRFAAWQGRLDPDPDPGSAPLPWTWPPLVRYVRSRFELWPYLALIVAVAPIYIACLPSGLTEAHRGEDGAELVAAAVTGGVAHPTGYPLYLLVLRGLCVIYHRADPIDVAHLFSATCAILAALGLLATLRLVLRHFFCGPAGWWVDGPALTAAGAFCFLGTVWNQAVIAEVYALHALFVSAVLYQISRLLFEPEARETRARRLALTFGLGLCHHGSLIQLLPAAILTLFWVGGLTRRSLLPLIGYGLAGLAPYLWLLVAARQQPALSWGNPDTLSRWFATISGEQYRDRWHSSLPAALQRIGERCALVSDAGHLAMIVGLSGAAIAIYWTISSGRGQSGAMGRWLLVVTVALLGNLLGSGGYDIEDLRSYFIPTEMLFAMAVGLGIAALAFALRGERGLSRPAGAFVALISFVTVASIVVRGAREADLHGRHGLDRQVRRIVAEAPQGALLIGHGDGLMFGLWYERFVRGGRRDLDILNRDLLAQDFYIGLANHFTPRMRWPPDIDAHDGRLNPVGPTLRATVRANYGHRPIIALRDYDALLGCRREASGRLLCPEP